MRYRALTFLKNVNGKAYAPGDFLPDDLVNTDRGRISRLFHLGRIEAVEDTDAPVEEVEETPSSTEGQTDADEAEVNLDELSAQEIVDGLQSGTLDKEKVADAELARQYPRKTVLKELGLEE